MQAVYPNIPTQSSIHDRAHCPSSIVRSFAQTVDRRQGSHTSFLCVEPYQNTVSGCPSQSSISTRRDISLEPCAKKKRENTTYQIIPSQAKATPQLHQQVQNWNTVTWTTNAPECCNSPAEPADRQPSRYSHGIKQ